MTINNSGESTLLEHLEALRLTLWRCVLAIGIALIPALYFSADLLSAMVRFVCPPGLKMHYFSPPP